MKKEINHMLQVFGHVPRRASSICSIFVTRFAKTRHNGAFLEIQIIASVGSIYLKLCSVAIPMLYCK